MTTATPERDEYRRIPLAQLHESSSNPRKTFDTEYLNELAASIKQNGVVQPITVRPNGKGFEIVAGACRVRASKIAAVADIPAVIRTLTDAQVITIQIVENLQRKNVHPLEEAAGFASLMDKKAMGDAVMTAEQVSKAVGKSPEYVYARVKLNQLEKPARTLMQEGGLQTEHGVLIARLDSTDQSRALDFCKREQPNVKELRQWVDEDVRWKNARTTASEKLSELKKAGTKAVLISAMWGKHSDSAVFLPKGTLFDREYRSAIDKPCKSMVTGVWADKDKAGKTQDVCTNEKCKIHPRGHVYTPPAPPSKETIAKRKKKESAAKIKKNAEALARNRCVDALLAKAKFDVKNLQLIAHIVLDATDWGQHEALGKRHGITGNSWSVSGKLRKVIDKATKPEALQKLILEFALFSEHVADDDDDVATPLYERHNVDRKKIHAEIMAQLVPAKPEPVATSKGAKPKVQTSAKPAKGKKPARAKKAAKPKSKKVSKKSAKKVKRRG